MKTSRCVWVFSLILLVAGFGFAGQAITVEEAREYVTAIDQVVADAAEQAIPAVVRIETEAKIRRAAPMQDNGFDEENPFKGTPFEDLFKGGPWFRQRGDIPPDAKAFSLGSGIVLDAKQGIVLTNNHVVKGAENIKVIAMVDGEEQEFQGEIAGQDPLKEIAVVKITDLGDAKLVQAKMGDSESLRVGETVIAIGNPFQYSHSVSKGIVSGKGRTSPFLNSEVPYQDFIQTDAAINPGNSGGPLLNLKGEVIGINTFIAVAQGSAGFNGLGFAIPIHLIESKLDALVEKGKVAYSYLGVMIQPVPDDVRKHSDIPGDGGALVENVVEDGPADKAGLEEQDIILEFEGQPVKGSRELVHMVGEIPVKKKVSLKVYRPKEKKVLTFSMVTAERPVEISSTYTEPETKEALGLHVANLKDAGIESDEEDEGVVVVSVDEDSPASDLRPRDIILEVEWTKIGNVDDFWKAVSKARNEHKSKGVLFRVKRGESTFLMVIPFEEEEKSE